MRAASAVERDRLAVHEIGHARRACEARQPAHDLAGVGVRRHRVDALDARGDRDDAAEQLDLLRAVDEQAAARAGAWKPTNSTVFFGSGSVAREMVQHAAAGRHAARRDDDRRLARRDEVRRLLRRGHRRQPRRGKRRRASSLDEVVR